MPNDPLVKELKPIQVAWINWNLQRESNEIDGNTGGLKIESAKDVPEMLGAAAKKE